LPSGTGNWKQRGLSGPGGGRRPGIFGEELPPQKNLRLFGILQGLSKVPGMDFTLLARLYTPERPVEISIKKAGPFLTLPFPPGCCSV
jgi:hypothetical protein